MAERDARPAYFEGTQFKFNEPPAHPAHESGESYLEAVLEFFVNPKSLITRHKL